MPHTPLSHQTCQTSPSKLTSPSAEYESWMLLEPIGVNVDPTPTERDAMTMESVRLVTARVDHVPTFVEGTVGCARWIKRSWK